MNFLPAGMGKLRRHLAMAAFALAAAFTALWHAADARQDAETELKALVRELDALRIDHHGSHPARYQNHAAAFATMRNRGWVGGERRGDWMRQLDEIHARWQILTPAYRFSPARPLGDSPGEGYRYHGSNMRWQMQLAHEGRLLSVLDDLQKNAGAIIHVRSCMLVRRSLSAIDRAPLAHLDVDCQIDWITLHPPGAGS